MSGITGDGSNFKKAGGAAIGGGALLQGLSILGASSANRRQIRSNAFKQQESLKTQQRAEFGSMIAQAGQSGLEQGAFTDIFNNQTIEDARQFSELKQQAFNQIAADKNAKRRALVSLGVKTASQVATLGAAG